MVGGLTREPRLTCVVAAANAPSTVADSSTGSAGSPVSASRWSDIQTESKPERSAARTAAYNSDHLVRMTQKTAPNLIACKSFVCLLCLEQRLQVQRIVLKICRPNSGSG